MRCFQSEERLSNLVISLNKDLLKNMKVECGVGALYNEVINEFAKMKGKIELIYK